MGRMIEEITITLNFLQIVAKINLHEMMSNKIAIFNLI